MNVKYWYIKDISIDLFNYLLRSRLRSPLDEINYKSNSIFIHIPKTAGSSICNSIVGKDVGHIPLCVYELFSDISLKNYFTYTFVRNPIDRFESAFYYLKAGGGNKLDKKWANKYNLESYDINEFIHLLINPITRYKIMRWIHFIPQYKFLQNSNNEIHIDFIARFENIEHDFKELCKKLDIFTQLDHINVTKHKTNIIDLSSKKIIYKYYKKDFNFFNYVID